MLQRICYFFIWSFSSILSIRRIKSTPVLEATMTKQPEHCDHLHSFPLPANKNTSCLSNFSWQRAARKLGGKSQPQIQPRNLAHTIFCVSMTCHFFFTLWICTFSKQQYWYSLPDSQSTVPAKDALSGQLINKTGKFCCKWSLRAAPLLLSSKLLCFMDTLTCFTKSREAKIISKDQCDLVYASPSHGYACFSAAVRRLSVQRHLRKEE